MVLEPEFVFGKRSSTGVLDIAVADVRLSRPLVYSDSLMFIIELWAAAGPNR
jgi:hypothetical protein